MREEAPTPVAEPPLGGPGTRLAGTPWRRHASRTRTRAPIGQHHSYTDLAIHRHKSILYLVARSRRVLTPNSVRLISLYYQWLGNMPFAHKGHYGKCRTLTH